MPQMAPMNWTILYFYLTFLFLFFIIISFYWFMHHPNHSPSIKFIKKYYWK
uniref:ATP synthase complex subunit 8 n=1 Tax=Coleoptera sp. 1 AH-2016 TaxID=1903823 RepID=A0A343C2E2_9COLE|nr:ATP synthase F0 subunit 8 [Coleoptera sp. 1 AH-2016]